jgi:hypothetical protein
MRERFDIGSELNRLLLGLTREGQLGREGISLTLLFSLIHLLLQLLPSASGSGDHARQLVAGFPASGNLSESPYLPRFRRLPLK